MRKARVSIIFLCALLLVVASLTGCDDGLPSASGGEVGKTSASASDSVSASATEGGSAETTAGTVGNDFVETTATTTAGKGSSTIATTTTTGSQSQPDTPPASVNTVYDMAAEGKGNLTITDKQGNVAQCEYLALDKKGDGSGETWSDFTFIDGKLWVFFASSGETHSKKNGQIRIYNHETGKIEKIFYHDFGHVNTVDYNKATDQLLVGNLPGNDTYPAAIYIYDNVSSWMNEPTGSAFALDDKVSTIVDVSAIVRAGTTHSTNTVACWGEDNTTVYVSGSFNRYWWKVTLGTGTDNLGKGTYTAAAKGAFNGSYKVVWMREYTLQYSTYQECIQGMVYYNGQIHTANGHNEIQWWDWTVTTSGLSRSEHRVAVVAEDGSIDYSISEGIAIHDGYLYIGCLITDTGSDDYAANHSTCTGGHGIIKVKLK